MEINDAPRILRALAERVGIPVTALPVHPLEDETTEQFACRIAETTSIYPRDESTFLAGVVWNKLGPHQAISIAFAHHMVAGGLIKDLAENLEKRSRAYVIVPDGFRPPLKKIIALPKQTEFLRHWELVVDRTACYGFGELRIMTPAEIAEVESRYRIRGNQLPHIYSTDPMVTTLGARVGQYIQHSRITQPAGPTIDIRRVVEVPTRG